MFDCMTDLETLGTCPGSIILSVGACMYDDYGVGETFYQTISIDSCKEAFLSEDPKTVAWWERQSPAARKVFDDCRNPSVAGTLQAVLTNFNNWLRKHGGVDVRVWGNGASFDNALLYSAYDAAKIRPGWKFFNDRCYRTIKSLAPEIILVREGTYHNAVDDAISQAKHHIAVNDKLGIKLA